MNIEILLNSSKFLPMLLIGLIFSEGWKLRYIRHGTALAILATLAATSHVFAQTANDEAEQAQATEKEKKAEAKKAKDDVFQLGRILVPAAGVDGGTSGQKISQSVVTPQEVYSTNRNTLDDALRTVPGVEVSTTGGRRNERLLYVRGFDRFQVPLSIDSIRVYLPADNRLDFGRFLTPDLSEI